MTTTVREMRRAVRLEQHGCVLSEILRRLGATHSIFDVLAVAVHCFAPGRRVAMLGFAGGGMIAPLRMLGGEHAVEGVDLSDEGFRLFRSVARRWMGEVRFAREDAVRWLERRRGRFDAIVEDLSVPVGGDVVKPAVSWEVLPAVMERKVRAGGVVIANLLPTPGVTWRELMAGGGSGSGVVLGFAEYQNRVVIRGEGVGEAREAGRRLRQALAELGSRMGEGLTVRGLGRAVQGDGQSKWAGRRTR